MQITSAASVTTMATRREKGTFGPTRRIQVVPHSSEEDEEKGLHYISLAGFFLSLFFFICVAALVYIHAGKYV